MGRKLNGFTLAEVLITLVIIGIIAAMTIPTLMNKTNEQELVVATKKAYSVLSQAYQRVIAENGEINPATLGENPHETIGSMFAKQLSVQKICGVQVGGDCFAKVYKGLNNRVVSDDYDTDFNSYTQYKMRLSDGMSVCLYGNSSYGNKSRTDSEPLNKVIGGIYVDVNGDKGPNVKGIDLFTFRITPFGLFPSGSPDDTVSFDMCKYQGQTDCAAWVITKGNMDYLHKDVSW